MITNENYYEPNNKALTHSKIKDYAICPHYFYRKHVLGEIEPEEKDAFVFGAIVDRLLSGEAFAKKYEIAEGIRTAKKKAEASERGAYLITKSDYNEILNTSIAIEETDAFKVIDAKASKQEILQVPFEINKHFDCLAGKPDFFWIENQECYIVDLKTTASVAYNKYSRSVSDFGYDTQLGMYAFLLQMLEPRIKRFHCYNLAVSKEKNLNKVELFLFPEERIEAGIDYIKWKIEDIMKEDSYAKYNPSFSSPTELIS